jgi:hypothetical protein
MSDIDELDSIAAIKLRVARAQLATALDLFIRDKDPISVQCLACGGGEVVEAVAILQGTTPFSTIVLEEHPNLDFAKLRKIRNQYWNAFKHLHNREIVLRDDEALLSEFEDTKNDATLFIGWRDYGTVARKMPIHAQVFQVWWYATNEGKLNPNADFEGIRSAFPGIGEVGRDEQKRRLRRAIEKWRNNPELLADPKSEPRLHDYRMTNWSERD